MNLDEEKFSPWMVKEAFWETFHGSGELWFDYLGSEKEKQNSTENKWREFAENLTKIRGRVDKNVEGGKK